MSKNGHQEQAETNSQAGVGVSSVVSKEIKKELKIIAKERKWSVSQLVAEMIETSLKKYKK